MGRSISNHQQQAENIKKQDQERSLWYNELLKELSEALRHNEELSNDLASETKSRRDCQHEIATLNTSLTTLQNEIRQSSYVIVLLDADADGYVFDNSYLEAGADGGRLAAENTQRFVRDRLPVHGASPQCRIVARVFANTEALSRVLERSGLSGAQGKVLRFVQGFNQVKFCDFVSVGSGKDKADEKIKALFELALQDPTCQHIVLGACHDNGYVRMLEQVSEPRLRKRVSLLKSFETGGEFATLKGFREMRLPGLFRTVAIQGGQKAQESSPDTSRSSGVSPTLNVSFSKPGEGRGHQAMSTKPIPQSEAGARDPLVTPLVLVNSMGQRIDVRIPRPDEKSFRSWKGKTHRGLRFCHEYFLLGQCLGQNGSHCRYEHIGLDTEEALVMRLEILSYPCKIGLGCRKEACLYGHECPKPVCNVRDCGRKFSAEMHSVSRE